MAEMRAEAKAGSSEDLGGAPALGLSVRLSVCYFTLQLISPSLWESQGRSLEQTTEELSLLACSSWLAHPVVVLYHLGPLSQR